MPPTLVFRGTSMINGRQVPISYEIFQDEKKLSSSPQVQVERDGDLVLYHVQASPEQANRILSGVNDKAAREGKRIVDSSGSPVTPAAILAQAELQRISPEISLTWDFYSWVRAGRQEFAKIALGAAHFTLGESFSRSKDAEALRQLIFATDSQLEELPLLGAVWPVTQAENPLRVLEPALGSFEAHLIGILNLDGKLTAFVSLFREMNALLYLSSNPQLVGIIPPNDGIAIEINPESRIFRQRSFAEILIALAKAGENSTLIPI